MYSNGVAMVFFPIILYLLVVRYDMAIVGCALSNDIVMAIRLICNLIYTRMQPELEETRVDILMEDY